MDVPCRLLYYLAFYPLVFAQTQNPFQQTPAPPGPVTINTFGSCASAELETRLKVVEDMVTTLRNQGLDHQGNADRLRDCVDVYNAQPSGVRNDGIYEIWPDGAPAPIRIYCVFDSEGLWTEIQRREDGGVNFQRNWYEYKKGFGSPGHNFWIGLDNLHALSTQRQYTLRVDIYDWDNLRRTALYRNFYILGEKDLYALIYHFYTPIGSSDAGDALGTYHYNASFSTFDNDNDGKASDNCALEHGGGWWYNDCDHANLNGAYEYNGNIDTQVDMGIEWDTWKARYSFKKAIMKLKPTYNQ